MDMEQELLNWYETSKKRSARKQKIHSRIKLLKDLMRADPNYPKNITPQNSDYQKELRALLTLL